MNKRTDHNTNTARKSGNANHYKTFNLDQNGGTLRG